MALRLPGFGRRAGPGDDDQADYGDPESEVEAGYADDGAEALPPNRMRGREPLQTAVVAVVLGVVGLLNLLITTGSGAPKHPTLWLSWVGIVLAIALAATIRFRSRLVSPFVAIIAAFFVDTAKAPTSLSIPHFVALLGALGYALALSMRQRREQKALLPARGASRGRRRRGDPEPQVPVSKRPAPSRRYTPPKSQTVTKKGSRTTRR